MGKSKSVKFFVVLLFVLTFLGSLVLGGYFLLDKVVVPKYFGEYGIENMGDLVEMMGTLYSGNNQKDIVTNGFSAADTASAESKLIGVGFPVLTDGTLDYNAFTNSSYVIEGEPQIEFSDKELASILDKMLSNGVLAEKLPNLKYLNTLEFDMLEVIIRPTVVGDGIDPLSANIEFTIKIDTTSARSQMATTMEMPLFLLNMIFPNSLYVHTSFEICDNAGEWEYLNGNIGINGRTSKQSEILLGLLIGFIFDGEDEMTISKLNSEFGRVVISGLDLLGDVRFSNSIGTSNKNGIIATFK